jgi:hypothetical protein
MRKITRFLLAAGLGLAGLLFYAVPASAAGVDVLTTGSIGGPNVHVGDTLTAPLKSGTAAKLGPVSCTSSAINLSVTTNPAAGGVATAKVVATTFGSCVASGTNITCVRSLSFGLGTVSIDGSSKVVTWNSPGVTVVFCTALGNITCTYQASSAGGKWSNADNSISFNATLTKNGGPSLCPSTLPVSIVWAPVTDGGALVFAQ